MDNTSWFRKKNTGYGWTPNNWKGWLVTMLGILLFVAVFRWVLGLVL